MYALVRCKVDFLSPMPLPVLKQPLPPFPYALARSQSGSLELLCEVSEGFDVNQHFTNPTAVTNITSEMYQAMLTRYLGWGLKLPQQWLGNELVCQDIVFFVASEDYRPIAVEVSTPQYENLYFNHFEGVSLVKAKATTIGAVLHYWPDSFCHQLP